MKELIGKAIEKIYLDSANHLLKFVVKDELNLDKEVIYGLQGDCCSESWFSDIIGFSNIEKDRNGNYCVVQNIINLSLGRTYLRSRQEVDEVSGFLIQFKHGDILILHRNSSNGYYGGWCNIIDSFEYFENINFVELKDDYYEHLQNRERN